MPGVGGRPVEAYTEGLDAIAERRDLWLQLADEADAYLAGAPNATECEFTPPLF